MSAELRFLALIGRGRMPQILIVEAPNHGCCALPLGIKVEMSPEKAGVY